MSYGNRKQLKCVFSFHKSKIRELSDGNRVIESQTTFCVMGPTIFELGVMEIEI